VASPKGLFGGASFRTLSRNITAQVSFENRERRRVETLLKDFSLEMTGKDASKLDAARDTIPPGVRNIGVGGYPEGHPAIPESVLWSALEGKAAALAHLGLSGVVITQFGFDVDPVLKWLEAVRERGIDLPVRIGVPGPAGVRRLLTFATRFGVGTSAGIAKKYGFSITNLMGTAGPDKFIRALAKGVDPGRHGEVKLHFYTFGGLKATSEWIAEFRKRELA